MKCDGKWCKSNSTEISDPTLVNMYLRREYGTTELVKRINSALAFVYDCIIARCGYIINLEKR